MIQVTTASEIYNILIPLKQQTLDKIRNNLNEDKSKLNIMKAVVPEINVFGTFERTFSTCLGHKLQEIAAVCGTNVVNIDKAEGKVVGVDLRTDFGEGQMKLGKNTQTGTHKKDSVKKLLNTTTNNNTNPFFVTALGESYQYLKDGILYIGGRDFWEKINIDYDILYDTIVRVIKETDAEVKSTFVPSLQ